eukprot:TRINITY_DN15222_c0_g1_i2.p4 TRINITY_DN15222_c0_g1~~TRINITY_DN15222_c0_g1_i2.p4  ORF type:complete len:139 (+),score=7.69 TRINITY_DN15222_c0_g1_i2:94-510(+)
MNKLLCCVVVLLIAGVSSAPIDSEAVEDTSVRDIWNEKDDRKVKKHCRYKKKGPKICRVINMLCDKACFDPTPEAKKACEGAKGKPVVCSCAACKYDNYCLAKQMQDLPCVDYVWFQKHCLRTYHPFNIINIDTDTWY